MGMQYDKELEGLEEGPKAEIYIDLLKKIQKISSWYEGVGEIYWKEGREKILYNKIF